MGSIFPQPASRYCQKDQLPVTEAGRSEDRPSAELQDILEKINFSGMAVVNLSTDERSSPTCPSYSAEAPAAEAADAILP